jgi:hypothetical protein
VSNRSIYFPFCFGIFFPRVIKKKEKLTSPFKTLFNHQNN